MIKPVIQKNAAVLRQVACEVPFSHITTPEIQKIIQDMKDTLRDCTDGLAIAAPQIGESVKIFVISGRFFNPEAASEEKPFKEQTPPGPDTVFINPEIIKRSSRKKILEEGCLSARWLYGDIRRSEKVTIRAYDETGKKITRGASGLLAEVFQHETDHLKGILFIDSAKNIREIYPENHTQS